MDTAFFRPFLTCPWNLIFIKKFVILTKYFIPQDVSAPLAALIYTSEPLWGAFFAWTLLGEHWGATGWVGAFLIVSATLYAQLKTGENEEVPEEERPNVKVEVYETSSSE